MHLLRVQIPEFRALKDVDLEFDKNFRPKVFPLGSQNGGGKSTFLQLIFVLLHCPTHPSRLPFLKTLLAQVSIPEGQSHKVLAKMDIWDGEKVVQIEFLCCNDSFLEPLKSSGGATTGNISFSSLFREQSIKGELERKEIAISIVGGTSGDPSRLKEDRMVKEQEYASVRPIAENIMEFLKMEKLLPITDYSNSKGQPLLFTNYLNPEGRSLLCRIAGMEVSETQSFLHKLADKVFLAAPSTQVYLFLSPKDRELLFNRDSPFDFEKNVFTFPLYEEVLRWSKMALPGFFTYEITSSGVITESFIMARNQDFVEMVDTGKYGNRYQQMLKEMNKLLATGKRVLPKLDQPRINFDKKSDVLQEILFKTPDGTELYPEDLSHGELKRLSIYAWLKYRQIEDAIVLMDEVENALHPDWQYQVVLDLTEWGPTNQYILATHSYELCQALTPAHVNELEPKLLPAR